MFRLGVLVNQSDEKDCEPDLFIEEEGMRGGNPWDTSGENGWLCGSPAIFSLTGKCGEMVCAE